MCLLLFHPFEVAIWSYDDYADADDDDGGGGDDGDSDGDAGDDGDGDGDDDDDGGGGDDDDDGGGGDVHDHEDDRYHVTFSWLPARSNVGFAANMF